MSNKTSDINHLHALKSGNTQRQNQALKEIYEDVYPKVERFISQKGGSTDQAFDVFQEALLIVFKHIVESRFREESSISTYLQVICRNIWYDQVRKLQKMQSLQSKESEIYLINEDDVSIINSTYNIDKLIKRLSDECQAVIRLFYFDKKKMTEIQAHFGLQSEQAARNKKYKCLKGLTKLCKSMNLKKEDISYE